ncbi:hypothetical protein Q7P37_004096 [Cladosporium fusiforme]
MAMESHHICLALAAFATFLLLSASEDWRATFWSAPHLFCAGGMPAVIYTLLVQRSGWSAEKYQLQIDNGAKIDAQQASHQKRERERDALIASLEQTIASQAKKLGMAEDAAFHRNTDVFLENNRLKRELRQVAANGVEATTLGNAEVTKRKFDSIRATLADAGYNCASPKDFRLAIERLCNRRPFGAQKLQVAQNVAPVAARSSVPLSDDVERVRTKNDKLGEKLLQTAENLRQRSADLEKAQQHLAREKDTVQDYEKKMAQMEDSINSHATAKSQDDEQLKCLRALVNNHAAQLQEYQNVHNRAYDKTRDEFNAAKARLESENNRLEALVQSCQEKQNKSTDLKSLQDGVNSDQSAKVFKLNMQIRDLKNDLKAKQAELNRHGNNDDELKKLQKEVFKKEEDLGEQWNKFNKVQQQLTDTQREPKKQNDEVESLREQLDRAAKDYNEATSKLESLEKEIAGSPSQAKVTK